MSGRDIPIDTKSLQIQSREDVAAVPDYKGTFVAVLTNEMIDALRNGSAVTFTVAYDEYTIRLESADHYAYPPKEEWEE